MAPLAWLTCAPGSCLWTYRWYKLPKKTLFCITKGLFVALLETFHCITRMRKHAVWILCSDKTLLYFLCVWRFVSLCFWEQAQGNRQEGKEALAEIWGMQGPVPVLGTWISYSLRLYSGPQISVCASDNWPVAVTLLGHRMEPGQWSIPGL